MRIAYLDCFSGISGDMFLGALVDAGVSPNLLEQTVEALGIGAKLETSRVNRSGISATKVDVIVDGKKDSPRLAGEAPNPHDHAHSHHHGHEHGHHKKQGAKHSRGLTEIKQIIQRTSGITESAQRTAIAIFEKLGAAEAKIHNIPVEKIHFHEVGAADAMVDIVCAAVAAESFGVDQFICSPLNVGGGTVTCAHGTFPVPAPATVELLKGAPVYSTGIEAELVTPTGAAIAVTLAKEFRPFPAMKIEKTGYGAGTRDLPNHANVLRITIGETVDEEFVGENTEPALSDRIKEGRRGDAPPEQETVSVLEANLDDLSPQVVGYAMDRLLEAGALDVFAIPVQMKKNRPGAQLTVLARNQDADALTKIIFAETTTLGVRRRSEHRQVLARKWQKVSTRFGDIRIKVASLNGSVTNYAPEYEDCRRIAAEQRVPLKSVMQEAVQEFLKLPQENKIG